MSAANPAAPSAWTIARPSARRPAAAVWITVGAVLAGWFVLWQKLSVDWSVNEQYQYGWFVPPLALALLALRWRDRPEPTGALAPTILLGGAGMCLLALAPLRLVEEPNGDWRMLFWAHAGALTLLTFAVLDWSGGRAWVRHFAFPVGFLLLAIPWPSGPEQALVQTLMRTVAAIASDSLNLLGIPAVPQGNLIRIRDQVVGVNEACSGIRSLQTVLMGALMLGELSRLSWPRRLALLAGGIAVALVANVFRSSLLVWIAARSGVAALEHYHDAAGMVVLLVVFAGLLGLGKLLDRSAVASPSPASSVPGRSLPFAVALAALLWIALVETGTSAWYRLHERNRARMPSWTVAPPVDAPNFQALPVDHLTRSLLRYDSAQSARWRRPGAEGPACTMFFFRWEPGRTSATLATMHQPTVCLPASGMIQLGAADRRTFATPIGLDIPVEQYEFLHNRQHLFVFYAVWQDRAGYALPTEQVTRSQRLGAALAGQRNMGQQTLEMVLTGPADQAAAAEAFSRELAAVIRPKN